MIDLPENGTDDELDAALNALKEEICADAYAGINAFSAHAEKFRQAAQTVMEQDRSGYIAKAARQAQDAQRTAEKYSVETEHSSAERYRDIDLSKDGTVYTYDFLTALPDMNVTTLPEVSDIRDENGRVDTAAVVQEGMKNARTVGTERDGKVFVRNRYTGKTLMVTTNSIRHGINGAANRVLTNARLGAVIGDVVQNAVPVNALYNKAKDVTGTYAMAGYATDSAGREFAAIVTVEQKNGKDCSG